MVAESLLVFKEFPVKHGRCDGTTMNDWIPVWPGGVTAIYQPSVRVCAAVKVDYSSLVFCIPPMNKN